MEWTSGQRVEKMWTFQVGGLNRASIGGSEPEVGFEPVVYSFETSRIKDPLFGWLQSHGWQHKASSANSSRANRQGRRHLAFILGRICAIFLV